MRIAYRCWGASVFHQIARVAALVLVALVASGCAVKLAPDYDRAVVDGLTKANTDAMTLFASYDTSPYSKRDAAYDTVIGGLNAVQVQVKARGTPAQPAFLKTIATGVNEEKVLTEALDPPTVKNIDSLVKIITVARRDDQKGRIKGRADFFVEAFSIQMAQTLAYEKALQR